MNLPLLVFALEWSFGGTVTEPRAQAPARGEAPSDDAESFVRKHLGLELAVTQSRIRRSVISTRTPYGFLITDVQPHSPAARAGLRRGDILLEWDGAPLREVEELAVHARELRAGGGGASVKYARKREGVPLTFPATDPWETRQTRIRPAASRRRPIGPI